MKKEQAFKKIGRAHIALIHVAKAKIGMTEPEYRDLLGAFGCESSKQLTAAKFEAVMKHFYNMGFPQQINVGGVTKTETVRSLLARIERLKERNALHPNYIAEIARRRKIRMPLKECTPKELHLILNDLLAHTNRQIRKQEEDSV